MVWFGNNVDIDEQSKAESKTFITHIEPILDDLQDNSVGKYNFQQMYYENEKLCVKRIHTPSQLQFAEEPLSEQTVVWEAL